MFEKFTENAINLIYESQKEAKLMQNVYVQPEHLLLAIIKNAKGIPLRFFKTSHLTYETLKGAVEDKLKFEKTTKEQQTVPFSEEFKDLLKNVLDLTKKTENRYVLSEILFIAVLSDKRSYCVRILEKFNFNVEQAKEILFKLVQKKKKTVYHPELEEEKITYTLEDVLKEDLSLKIIKSAEEKMNKDGKELIGTDYILSAILDMPDLDISKILMQHNVTAQNFDELMNSSRECEYYNKKLFTPCAKEVFELSSQMAKELGSSILKPEHFILALLKIKKGQAWETFKKMGVDEKALSVDILNPIEKQMPQALVILKLAKEEARRLGRNIVGTEMILLGILSEGFGIGFEVLNRLGIKLKDLRLTIENTIGYGNEYFDKEIIFTRRAKRILEVAWQRAKKAGSQRIMSEHLLYAITTEPLSLAMNALEQLGVDAVEIRQGILREIEA
ncbi:hypothetical protein IJ732_02810 [bacterium]|nr:hypothetical protein [bacterium]